MTYCIPPSTHGSPDALVEAADHTVSPALSYLTLEDPPDDLTEALRPELSKREAQTYEVRQQTTSPYSRLLALPSSDAESDGDLEITVGGAKNSTRSSIQVDAVDHLLHANISDVKRYIKDTSDRQRQHLHSLSTQQTVLHSGEEGFSSDSDDSSKSDSEVAESLACSIAGPSRTRTTESRRDKRPDKVPCVGIEPDLHRKGTASSAVEGGAVTVTLPKSAFAKGRRLIVPADLASPISAIYMRGDVQFIDQRKWYYSYHACCLLLLTLIYLVPTSHHPCLGRASII